MNILRFVAPIIVGTSLLLFGYSAAGDPVYDVRVTEGIVYGHGEVLSPSPGLKPLLLDLYEPISPTTPDRRPVVLVIHGGAFMFGSRQFPPWVGIATELAKYGYVVASIDYRLSVDDPVVSERVLAALPPVIPGDVSLWATAAVEDGLTALEWLFDNSDTLYLDPTRLGVMGSSAGAATAIHLAYTVPDYGLDMPSLSYVVDFFGFPVIPPGDPIAAANHLETGEPPLFIVHGTEDSTVPIAAAQLLANRADDQGVPYEFHAIPGLGHGLDELDPLVVEIESGLTIFDRMIQWIDETLPVQVAIDIKPWHSSNRIFPWFGIVPVAVFGSADLDVDDVNIDSLGFGRDGAAAHPWVLRGFNINPSDDNFDDLIVFFRASQSGIRCGDPVATLTGSTSSGVLFSGADSITTVGCF